MDAKQTSERYDQLKQLRKPSEYIWSELGFLMNRRGLSSSEGQEHGYVPHSEIYDTTLRTKSRMQANGITSMLYPRDRDWLVGRPAFEDRHNKSLEKDYREAGEAILHYLRSSNFHTVNHSVIVDRSQLGTGTLRKEWIADDYDEEIMNFKRYECLDYVIDHDQSERVDTFGCEYNWSAYRAASVWGKDNLSSKLQKEVSDPKKRDSKHCFILLIEKRPSWDRKGSGTKGMRYSYKVVEKDQNHTVEDSGSDDFQIVASRYEIQGSPWGFPPAWEILPDAYKANYAAKFMMVMGERAAVPPILAPAYMKEEGVGLGAAEITYYSENHGKNPIFELNSGGNYSVGMDILKQLRDSIDEAYHGHLFNMFSRLDRDVTATEATMRREELNAQANPTLTALEQEHTKPIVNWAFHQLVEKGIIELPEEALKKDGKAKSPQFAFDNTFTNNHKRAKALEAMNIMDTFINVAGVKDEIDVLKWKELGMRIWRDLGQDEDDLLSEDEYTRNQEEKQAAMQAAQQAEQMKGAAEVAKNASQIDPSNIAEMASMAG